MAKLKYDDTFPLRAEDLARKGLIDKQIAKGLGIGVTTFYQYQLDYPEFAKALKQGKAPVDVEVENSLLKRARGFDYEEIHTEYRLKPGETKPDEKAKPSIVKRITKKVIPDVTACIFWLKNRRPDRWREAGVGIFDELGRPLPIRFIEVGSKESKPELQTESEKKEKKPDASTAEH